MNSTEKMEMEMIFEDMGFEADYEQEIAGVDIPNNYDVYMLNEFMDEDEISGKPVLSAVYTNTYEDDETGNIVENHKCELVIINDEVEQACRIKMNLKSDSEVQKNVHFRSQLFALVKGLAELKIPNCMDNYNRLKKVDLRSIRKQLEDMSNILIQVKEIESGDIIYNSFKIIG